MAKYIKKSVEVEAILWSGSLNSTDIKKVRDWLKELGIPCKVTTRFNNEVVINTNESVLVVAKGEYLVYEGKHTRGLPTGEEVVYKLYSCDAEVFEETHNLPEEVKNVDASTGSDKETVKGNVQESDKKPNTPNKVPANTNKPTATTAGATNAKDKK